MANSTIEEIWPALPFPEWKETAQTLHMWTQVVGKVRLALSPWTNHSWHVTLYLTGRGLTTSPIPFQSRILPTICVHMCKVSQVPFHSENGRAGQISLDAELPVFAIDRKVIRT